MSGICGLLYANKILPPVYCMNSLYSITFFNRYFIGTDVKLTMEAFTENQQGHSIGMEIVAASRTFTDGNHYCCQYQKDEPDAEECPHGPGGGGNVMNDI